MRLILASASPRRAELLRRVGLNPEIRPTDADETLAEPLSPEQTVLTLSCRKAQAAYASLSDPDALILAADTMVACGNTLLGKPRDEYDARAMLSELSGKTHQVYTGMTVLYGGKQVSRAVCTHVTFRVLSPEDIGSYVATGEPLDKAGAYGIQGMGSLLVKEIRGDYDNVVGLPVSELFALLKEAFGLTMSELITQKRK